MTSRVQAPGGIARIVAALGVTQIIGYGTIYYAFALMVPSVATSFGTTEPLLFGIFSVGLLAGGMVAPKLGALMDAHGAPRLMTLGSLAAGLLLIGLAVSPNVVVFAAIVVAIEIVSVAVLYDAAFAALVLLAGPRAKASITNLTLIAGFASTLFWPLTAFLVERFGWQATYAIFAALHLFVAVPIHAWLTRLPSSRARSGEKGFDAPEPARLDHRASRLAYLTVAVSFALSGMLIAAIGVHLVPILAAMALGSAATWVAMLMGPAQVAIRLINAVLWRAMHPLTLALISASALPVAIAMLLLPLPAILAGVLFSTLFGIGGGLSSIVRGTVPLALFGSDGYAARLGQLAAIRTVLSAGAPFLFAAGVAALGTDAMLVISIVVGLAAIGPLAMLSWRLRSRSS